MAKNSPLTVPPVVALLAWLLPGAGHLAIGQRARGFTIGGTILGLYILGLFIGGIRVVDPPKSMSSGRDIVEKPWYIGQILAGPITIVTAKVRQRKTLFRAEMHDSHARIYEIGVLYTAIAGMLNLLAIIDCTDRASRAEAQA